MYCTMRVLIADAIESIFLRLSCILKYFRLVISCTRILKTLLQNSLYNTYERPEDSHMFVSVNISVNGILGCISGSLSRRVSLDTPLRTTMSKSTPNFMDPAII